MLSEKRIKVRYSTDPNGNLWAADPNNFGRKMLEKYGWSPGKGLGKNSNGIKAPIKKGTRGLGMKSDFCLGIRQIDEYASLLRKLNNAHSSSDKTNAISECLPTSWRKGMKTLRSKDASKYDQQDLSIVLGHTRSFLEEKIASPNAPAKESGCQIPSVISPMSVSEYFAKAKKHRLQSEPQTYLVDVKSAKSIEIIVPVDQHVTSNSVSVKINDNEGFECRKIEEISNHEDVELIIPPLDPDKKIRRVETVNAGENVINSLFVQSNLLSMPGYCYY
ncbi:PIN2/TERF1-interacting telomerase inhibitor 1, variant 4 [Schistosoma haematobium]|uniref:PIN2/TERF1-interacting telomerase inhibitor 1, variant 4 n=1 Tax=Schistosoma haematobium TaxID=6185 RepID=A0A922LK42_SCHHA|nr:PIN2/TERF1-interacting telomerase inhibitor 1, variant 4 [Schistosoma haematobium]KAH9587642.1 PIN2/TERF1-interacting telomerase inhibitor 1, variant 4 [Schistosoma haematobium]